MHSVKYGLVPDQGTFMSLTFSFPFNIPPAWGLPLSRRGRDGAPPKSSIHSKLSECSKFSTAGAYWLSPPIYKADEESDETCLLDDMPKLHGIYNPGVCISLGVK